MNKPRTLDVRVVEDDVRALARTASAHIYLLAGHVAVAVLPARPSLSPPRAASRAIARSTVTSNGASTHTATSQQPSSSGRSRNTPSNSRIASARAVRAGGATRASTR